MKVHVVHSINIVDQFASFYNINMETYLITVDDNILINKKRGIGMSKIAYTSSPAIEIMGMAFSKKAMKKLYFQSELEQKIAGPLMIPMDIYRIEDDGYEYNVQFTEEVIKKIHETFMFNLNNSEIFNEEHNNDISIDSFITEIWIVEDPKTDKSFTKFNIEVPKGTLFAVTKIVEKETYDYLVTNNKIGFSIEGVLGLSLQEFNKNKNKEIKMEENTLKLPTGEWTIGDKLYVVDEMGNIVEIKDVVTASEAPVVEEEKKEEVVTAEEATPVVEEEKKEEEIIAPVATVEEAPISEMYTKAEIDAKLDEIYAMIAEMKVQEVKEDEQEAIAPSTDQAFKIALNSLIVK